QSTDRRREELWRACPFDRAQGRLSPANDCADAISSTEGVAESSPPLQWRVGTIRDSSPVGTNEFQPSLQDLSCRGVHFPPVNWRATLSWSLRDRLRD